MKALFIPFPMHSHVNGILKIARILKGKGFLNTFAIRDDFEGYVAQQGFQTIQLNGIPFGLGYEDSLSLHEKGRQTFVDSLIDRMTNRVFIDRQRKLLSIMETVNPTHIFLDGFTATDFIILYKFVKSRNAKIFSIQTALSTYENITCPPLSSKPYMNGTRSVKYEWFKLRLSRTLKDLKQRLIYFGFSDQHLVKINFRSEGLDSMFKVSSLNPFQISFRNVQELVLVPEKFDLGKNKSIKYQTHLGYLVDGLRIENVKVTTENRIQQIKQKKESGCKVIYISFGSGMLTYANVNFSSFLSKIVGIANSNKNLIFIVAAPVTDDSPTFENINFIEYAPQLEILKFADLFITTGGTNSVKESIVSKVPMLVFPWKDMWDKRGTASLVSYHKIGLVGELGSTQNEITNQIWEVINNLTFKENLSKCLSFDPDDVETKLLRIINSN